MFRTVLLAAVVPLALGSEYSYIFSLNSTGLGFAVESFSEAEKVTDAILDQIDIPCPP